MVITTVLASVLTVFMARPPKTMRSALRRPSILILVPSVMQGTSSFAARKAARPRPRLVAPMRIRLGCSVAALAARVAA